MAHIFQSSDYGAELEAEKERQAAKKLQKAAAKAAKAAEEADLEAGMSSGGEGDDHDPALDKLSIMTAASTRSSGSISYGQRVKRWFKKWYRKLGLKHLISLIIVAVYTLIGGVTFSLTEYSADVAKQTEEFKIWQFERQEFLDKLQQTSLAQCGRPPEPKPDCECKCSEAKEKIFDQLGFHELFGKLEKMDDSIAKLEPVMGRIQEITAFNYLSAAARNDLKEALGWYKSKVAEFDTSPEGIKLKANIKPDKRIGRVTRQTDDLLILNNGTAGSDNPFHPVLAEYEDAHGFAKSIDPTWHFWNCLYFSATLYTTIGYGNIACGTFVGQLFTIIYGLIGIPIFISTLNEMGKWLFRIIHMSMCQWDEWSTAIRKKCCPKETKLSTTKSAIFSISTMNVEADIEEGGGPGGHLSDDEEKSSHPKKTDRRSKSDPKQIRQRRTSGNSDMSMGQSWFLWTKAPTGKMKTADVPTDVANSQKDQQAVDSTQSLSSNSKLHLRRVSEESGIYEELRSDKQRKGAALKSDRNYERSVQDGHEEFMDRDDELMAIQGSCGKRSALRRPSRTAIPTESGSETGSGSDICGRYEQQITSAIDGSFFRQPTIVNDDEDGDEENLYQNVEEIERGKQVRFAEDGEAASSGDPGDPADNKKKSAAPALATAFLSPSLMQRAYPCEEYELQPYRMFDESEPFFETHEVGEGSSMGVDHGSTRSNRTMPSERSLPSRERSFHSASVSSGVDVSDRTDATATDSEPVGFAQSFRRSTKRAQSSEDEKRERRKRRKSKTKRRPSHYVIDEANVSDYDEPPLPKETDDLVPPDPDPRFRDMLTVGGKPFPDGTPMVLHPDDLLDNIDSLQDADVPDIDDIEDLEDDILEDEEEASSTPHIPVSVALFVTVGWIFFCAALFCIWEDWDYWEAIYFFFISLSTIGLGDVVPAHPDYMVGCFLLVIIGLSLVSMCINVVQQAIEDAYMALLMSILMEYQRKMAEGGDDLGAAAGMVDMWNTNFAAKMLLPLMGADKKANVMAKFQDEAKAKGIELPPVLQNIDRETGLPAIVSDTKKDDGEDMMAKIAASVEQAKDKAEKPKVETATVETQTDGESKGAPKTVVTQTITTETDDLNTQTDQSSFTKYEDFNEQADFPTEKPDQTESESQTTVIEVRETEMETDNVTTLEANVQTTMVTTVDEEQMTVVTETKGRGTQTAKIALVNSSIETDATVMESEFVQTEEEEKEEDAIQTEEEQKPLLETIEQEMQTDATLCADNEMQTDKVVLVPTKTQTDIVEHVSQELQTHLYDLQESEQQTEILLTEDDMTQTSQPDPIENEAQTDHTGPIPSAIPFEIPPEKPPEPDPESSSSEELAWDPVDGMHAEKQLPVGNLRSMFESGRVAQPADPKSKKKKKSQSIDEGRPAGPSRAKSFNRGDAPPPLKKLW